MYSSTTVMAVRTDNGGEFDGEFREMLRARRARNERDAATAAARVRRVGWTRRWRQPRCARMRWRTPGLFIN